MLERGGRALVSALVIALAGCGVGTLPGPTSTPRPTHSPDWNDDWNDPWPTPSPTTSPDPTPSHTWEEMVTDFYESWGGGTEPNRVNDLSTMVWYGQTCAAHFGEKRDSGFKREEVTDACEYVCNREASGGERSVGANACRFAMENMYSVCEGPGCGNFTDSNASCSNAYFDTWANEYFNPEELGALEYFFKKVFGSSAITLDDSMSCLGMNAAGLGEDCAAILTTELNYSSEKAGAYCGKFCEFEVANSAWDPRAKGYCSASALAVADACGNGACEGITRFR